MDHQWFAKITVPRQDGKIRTGSGFPVANGLLMTARHVVEFPERDPNQPITVHWLDGTVTETLHILDYPFEDANYDVVIFRCPTPQNVKPPAVDRLLSQAKIITCSEWQSVGFPKVNQFDLKALTGKFQVDIGQKIDLTLNSPIDSGIKNTPELNMQDGWGGMSGAAVFGIQSKKIEALIVECDLWMAGELKAITMPYLMALPAFRAAVGLRDTDQQRRQYIETQKAQIQQLLNQLADSKLLHEIQQAAKLPANQTADQLHQHLCSQEVLDVLDILLCAIAQTLKHDKTPSTIQQMLDLFQLFVSLLAPQNPVLKQAIIRLSAYSKIGAELELAAIYDTTPSYCEQQNEVCGKYAIDGGQLVRETGWDTAATLNEVMNSVALSVSKKTLKDPVNAFERRKLNTTIQQRQNRSINQLHRFELNLAEADSQNNPLLQEDFCLALNAADCLPDLPISHYGEQLSLVEADLSAKIEQLFDLLKSAGQLP